MIVITEMVGIILLTKLKLNNLLFNLKMIEYIMKLSEPWFTLIKKGNKTVELRLFDDKRKQLKVGDIIEFKHDISNKFFKKKIKKLKVFNSFEEALKNTKLKNSLPGIKTYAEGIDVYHSIKSYKEGEHKYGVLAIYLK
jgi:ASC-1-like (ASCH) protein